MPNISIRRLGVALLAAAVIFTTGTALADTLNLTGPGTVGAGQKDITAPCASVAATYTIAYRSATNAYYIDAVGLTGTDCTGTSLTVQITLKDGATNPESTFASTVTDITAGYSFYVNDKNVKASDLAGVVVLITGS
jgi:hypothetical protein